VKPPEVTTFISSALLAVRAKIAQSEEMNAIAANFLRGIFFTKNPFGKYTCDGCRTLRAMECIAAASGCKIDPCVD
jgi:hypothetical protein